MSPSDTWLRQIAGRYWGYSVRAVDAWLETGFQLARDSFPVSEPPLDRDVAAAEALAGALAAGHFALEGLDDAPLAHRLELAALEFAVGQGQSRELMAFYRRVLEIGKDDRQRCFILGVTLLSRLNHPDTDSLNPSIPVSVGSFLFTEAILSWRRAQDHHG